jgi:hypothetical protein
MVKEFWDFDENINYVNINVNGNNFKVLNVYKNYNEAAGLLNLIHNIIISMCLYLQINFYKYTNEEQIAIKCFLNIHPNRYLLSEMQLGTDFNGINKPRNIRNNNKNELLGKDKRKRAEYRHVFLTLRKHNGSFKSFDSIMRLVIHEIAHTMCNHVTWRDDDHNEDFQHYEALLNDVYKKCLKNI